MQALFEQASKLHQAGKLSDAETLYRTILNNAPGQPVVSARLAMCLVQLKRPPEALPLFEQAISALPNEKDLLKQASDVAVQTGRADLAAKWLKQLIALNPKSVELLEKLAGVLVANHQEKQALDYAKLAIKLKPKSANAYNIKGMAQSRLGDTEKGYKSIQKAVALDPSLLGATKNLILFGKGRKEPLLDKIIPQLRANFNSGKQPPMVQMNIAYVLANYYEKAKKHGDFFSCLKTGNDINRSTYQYSHQDTENRFKLIKDLFSPDHIKQQIGGSGTSDTDTGGVGFVDDTPIFILGMPRSATTLVEQILSSHSGVKAAGEITELEQQFQKYIDPLHKQFDSGGKAVALEALGKDYVSALKSRFGEGFKVTDKMPYNFIFIGLIMLALPKAKVIHCTREPLETCFSIYKQNFAGTHGYTDKLEEIGMYFNAYQGLMEYWLNLFGDRINEVNYEAIVEYSEDEIRRLLDYCELNHEEACFEFYKNKRAVRTASIAQVRQPIYKSALKASAPFTRQLKPLIDTLDSGKGKEF